MHHRLSALLATLRRRRGFDPDLCLEAKGILLNDYLARTNVRGCVVAVSGGVDSAVTLGLVRFASRMHASPIKRVVAVQLPIFSTDGATHQEIALQRGREVADAFGAEGITADLTESHRALRSAVERGAAFNGNGWSSGQLVSTTRTPAIYYVTTLLTQQGDLSVVCGTTNRDEGAYLGFFGKASDGMVDLQLLSDLHKSEVYRLAKRLGVPASVLAATPTGDTYDGRCDEEMIGAPYDFVELYTQLLSRAAVASTRDALSPDARAEFDRYAARVEALHTHNAHKYLVGSPAVHFDVYERSVMPPPLSAPPSAHGAFVGEFPLPQRAFEPTRDGPRLTPLADFGASAFVVHNLLSAEDCRWLRDQVAAQPRVPVGRDGRRAGFNPATDPVGSYRATAYAPTLADTLWERLRTALAPVRITDDDTSTDCDGHRIWRAVGLNPAMRFIWYEQGGGLIPHYDSAYDFGDGRRTLMSVVLSLTDADDAQRGGTRLLLDAQRHLPRGERDFSDQPRAPSAHETLARADAPRGSAVLIDHRVLHDADAWSGPHERLVLRTDVVFERCGPVLPAGPSPVPQPKDRLERKAMADVFYAGVFRAYGAFADVLDAGFFDDGADEGRRWPLPDDARWLVTPLHKLISRLARAPVDAPLAVILATGSFCPIHRGHLAMMERAREALEARGDFVLGGYLSVSHDEYVLKKAGSDAPGAAHRIAMCEASVLGSDWLMADPWEALSVPLALNFSDVVERLSAYLARNLRTHRPVRVWYVFGSDNARFARTFVTRGNGVCIPRPGHADEHRAVADDRLLRGLSRVVFATETTTDASSRRVRKGDDSLLTDAVRALWRARNTSARRTHLFLRDEGRWACGVHTEAWARFVDGLCDALREAGVEVTVQRLDEQTSRVRESLDGARVLSLDPCIQGDENLYVSRCFELASDDSREALVARPERLPIDQQLASLPPGRFALLDDDLASGRTMQQTRAMLPLRCEVTRVMAASGQSERAREGTDYCDARDFLAGAREGGLVVALPSGALARAPYALPYVRPAGRAGILLSREHEFSRRVWALSRAYYEESAPAMTVREGFSAFATLVNYVGFENDATMIEVCDWHLDRLGEITRP